MIAQAAANVETVAAGDHDVEKEKGRRLTFGIGNQAARGGIDAGREGSGFQVMLDQAGNVRVILEHKDGLAHREWVLSRSRPEKGGAYRPQATAGGQRECKRSVNSAGGRADSGADEEKTAQNAAEDEVWEAEAY